MTRSEIITRIAEAKTRKSELLEFPTTAVPATAIPTPAIPATNGHAAAGLLSYAGAQAEKERWAAALRKLEYQKKSGELLPVSYVRHWGVTFLTEARDTLLRGPSELADPLAAEVDPRQCEMIVQKWVERVMERFFQLERLWGQGDDAA